MKKSIFAIAILFSLFSVVLSSYTNDDFPSGTTDQSGTYKLIMDGNIVAEGTSTNKVMMFGNTVNMGGTGSDFVITITNVPESIGGVVVIAKSGADKSSFTIQGKNILESGADEIYWGISGIVTRTSASKISFQGNCKPNASGIEGYAFSGSIESDAFKVN